MSSVNIIQTPNSPAFNLLEQINQVKDQVVANAEFDNNVDGFKDKEIKLYMPGERFSNYKDNKENTVSLMCLFAVIIAIICYLHRTR
jgi:hypothetical protein